MKFLVKLGFEKKPVRKSAIIFGFLIALVTLITALNKILEKKDNLTDFAFAVLPFLVLLIPVIKTLLDGNGPKYVKKNKCIKSDAK